jgi:rubrerythrin
MDDTVQSLVIALQNEMNERDFYLRHSRRTRNPLGKAMFASIARDEEEHCRRLQQLHGEKLRTGVWPESIPRVIGTASIPEIISALPELADAADAPADMDDLQAVQTAIDFEQKAYAFYAGLGTRAAAAPVKDFFESLAAIEREHLVSLKDTLLYFEDPAAWFAAREKPHFEA